MDSEELLGISKTKSSQLIASMERSGLLERIGIGKDTAYRTRE